MGLLLLRRLGLAIAITAFAVALLFSMIHLVPGDPALMLLGPRATPELRDALRVRLGLDQPLVIQILRFYANLLRGDMGVDIVSDRPVLGLILTQLPHTVALVLASIFWAALVGVPLGCYSAVRSNSVADRVIGVVSIAVISLPYFLVAIYLLLVFAVILHWFPAMGVGESHDILSEARYLVLPSIAVGLGWVGYIARLVRASMLEVLGESHIRLARAFGLREWRIIFSYALPIAILPTVTILGSGIGRLFSSAVFAEVIFSRPGIGTLIYRSIGERDYPVVMGGVLVTTALFVVSITIADLVNAVLDPRARENI